jgi:hypothetical protein
MFKNSVLELNQPEGAVLFNLTAFPSGSDAILQRISAGQPGIYAWFRSFQFRENPEEFAEDLLTAVESPKFQARTGTLAPYYEVSLRSKSSMPESKQKALRNALIDKDFSSALRFSLNWAMLLQAPLYVGKSVDLKARVTQHLRAGSTLRARLMEAGIDIEKCHLLIVPLPDSKETPHIGNVDKSLIVESELAQELIFEEVFSRLFNPSFTIRLG